MPRLSGIPPAEPEDDAQPLDGIGDDEPARILPEPQPCPRCSQPYASSRGYYRNSVPVCGQCFTLVETERLVGESVPPPPVPPAPSPAPPQPQPPVMRVEVERLAVDRRKLETLMGEGLSQAEAL